MESGATATATAAAIKPTPGFATTTANITANANAIANSAANSTANAMAVPSAATGGADTAKAAWEAKASETPVRFETGPSSKRQVTNPNPEPHHKH